MRKSDDGMKVGSGGKVLLVVGGEGRHDGWVGEDREVELGDDLEDLREEERGVWSEGDGTVTANVELTSPSASEKTSCITNDRRSAKFVQHESTDVSPYIVE